MVRSIILDIDGIIIGGRPGYNFPDPHPAVIKKIKAIDNAGIPVLLCSARAAFSVASIARAAQLDSPHITENGGLILNVAQDEIIEEHPLKPAPARAAVKILLKANLYTEIYTRDTYYIQQDQAEQSQNQRLTQAHTQILGKSAQVTANLFEQAGRLKLYKLVVIIPAAQKDRVEELLQPLRAELNLGWTIHPHLKDVRFAVITPRGISKAKGLQAIARHLGLSLKNALGVGDSPMDWDFLKFCGYAATLANGHQEIKDAVKTKGPGHFFVGADVDENGLIEVLDHFIV